MEARDNITHQIKEAVRKSETKTFRAMETVWDRIEEKLDEDEQKERKVIPFRKISIAAAVLLLLSLGAVYVFQQNNVKQDNEQTYVQQVNEDIKPLTSKANTAREMIKEINVDNVIPEPPVVYTKPQQRKARRGVVEQEVVASHIDVNAVKIRNQSLENQELFAAPKTIKGSVTDEQGEGVAGAVVSVKGIRNSTLTDVNGNYEIVVRNGQKELEIKGVGLVAKTVDISKSEYVLATTLETDNAVVAIAIYDQEKDKKSFTGTVSSITSKEINKRPATDISRALEGEVPGVQITHVGARSGASDIVVRGMSVSGISGSPLIVIDGAYYNGTTVSLSSDEVESLTILKDGNATSVYGSRGVNGVIVIKTKNGKGYSIPKENIFQKMKSVFNKKDKKESEESED
jgi:Ca-activated chloride channel family protein